MGGEAGVGDNAGGAKGGGGGGAVGLGEDSHGKGGVGAIEGG